MAADGESTPGGIIHTYRRYDPMRFPMPAAKPPDMLTPAFNHLLMYGNLDELTEEQLAEAIEIDPSQIRGLGPSVASMIALLEARKRRILETYEAETVPARAGKAFREAAAKADPPKAAQAAYEKAIREEQISELERLWYRQDQRSAFARQLVVISEHLGNKYQVEELAAKYPFTGRRGMSVEEALAIKEELETIDRLIAQLREAAKNAKVYLIDMAALARFADESQMSELSALQRQVQEMMEQIAAEQGLKRDGKQFSLTPKAYRLFQTKLLERIFSELKAAKSGRHDVQISGDGSVELQRTKQYEFGDSLANMDVGTSLVNAMIREGQAVSSPPSEGEAVSYQRSAISRAERGRDASTGSRIAQEVSIQETSSIPTIPPSLPLAGGEKRTGPPARRIRLLPEDIEIHLTRNQPKCATSVLMDMSGSMRWGLQYVNVKRMALALHGLIRTDYPGDFVDFVEVCTLPKRRHISEVAQLLPKPVTIFDPVVRLKADMSDPNITEWNIPPHFTNIQQALKLARQTLQVQDTPNRQIILITDGLPTAHFEDKWLYMLYPPDRRTERLTMREGLLCREQGITINIFLLSHWSQNEGDVRFAHRLAESTKGRVFFVGGRELDRYVVWDYVQRRRVILG